VTRTSSAPGAVPVRPASGVPSQRSGAFQPGTCHTPDRCWPAIGLDGDPLRDTAIRLAGGLLALGWNPTVTEAARDRAVIAAGGLLAAGLYPKEET